jgi:hypothetical protein
MSVNENPPEWAFNRVAELVGYVDGHGPRGSRAGVAFARYIATHEDAPVDPLELEADNLASGHHVWANEDEYSAAISLALAALKRGMELASRKAST